MFDLFIVLLGFLPLLITHDEATYEAVLAARTLRIFRSLRSLRVLRLIGRFKQLRTIVKHFYTAYQRFGKFSCLWEFCTIPMR